ncbi:uncharacterized protein LOC133517206 [Cydia pomonella]|uniref:uncharacterized protein LOC133517206 n=1 Tax=Cydia pomonella TaxID=82600 RepID=UPI002ADDDDF4|nr:uncharacterized protein LOC133517206 [Cydia pomonella]XP_061706396.1 uncharacterized protein LOC133517206 [Cydia pomonella]
MPGHEAPSVELGSAPQTPSVGPSPSPSEISSTSTPEPQNLRPTPLFRALAMPPPEPEQPPGQDELERRLPGYRRIVIPRDLTLIELLKQSSGAQTDEEVLRIREAKLRVIAEQVGLRRLPVLAPRLRELTLDGSAVATLRDLGIGLARLKILSINRCGLTSLDGVWGLGALRELHAAGNRLRDIQLLAGLQKLHTLNLANNPIADSSRLWTLGVCDSLRNLTLRGTPLADAEDYRARVETALPRLQYLDDRPMHGDEEDDLETELKPTLSSDSDSECEVDTTATSMTPDVSLEPQPGPSNSQLESLEADVDVVSPLRPSRRRPATTECVGARPRVQLPPRPSTAHSTRERAPSRLHMLNTLMDEEWRNSGSRLTSQHPVCGNIARALRRPQTAQQTHLEEEEKLLVSESVENAMRAVAKEIPRAPCVEDWAQFRKLTGIDIEFDFEARPQGDASTALDRLEQIEKETLERLQEEALKETCSSNIPSTSAGRFDLRAPSECDAWSGSGDSIREPRGPRSDPRLEVDVLFNNIIAMGIESQH